MSREWDLSLRQDRPPVHLRLHGVKSHCPLRLVCHEFPERRYQPAVVGKPPVVKVQRSCGRYCEVSGRKDLGATHREQDIGGRVTKQSQASFPAEALVGAEFGCRRCKETLERDPFPVGSAAASPL